MTRAPVLSKKKVKAAILGSGGVILAVQQKCGCAYSTAWEFINREGNEELKQLMVNERDKIIDVAENKLFVAVKSGKEWAVKYTLNTIGKNRGYVEKQEVAHFGMAGIKIEFVPPGDLSKDGGNEKVCNEDKANSQTE